MTRDPELTAWLGPADAELTDAQYQRFADEVTAIIARYPLGADDEQERTAAMSAALQWILGGTNVAAAGDDLLRTRISAAVAMAAAQQVARMAVLDGAAEATTARAIGLDRMTVRKVVGK